MTSIEFVAFVAVPLTLLALGWAVALAVDWQSHHGAEWAMPAFLREVEPIKLAIIIVPISIGLAAAIFLLVTKSGP